MKSAALVGVVGLAAGIASAQGIATMGQIGDHVAQKQGQRGHGTVVLWDQSNFNEGINAFVDQEFSDFPTFSSYLVTDVTIAAGFVGTEVTTYFTVGFGAWPAAGIFTICHSPWFMASANS